MFRVVHVRLLTTKFMGTFFSTGRMFGNVCRTDYECAEELKLVCSNKVLGTCHCRRGYTWNAMNKICYRIKEYPYDNGMQLTASFSLEAFKISNSLLTSSMQQSPSWEVIRFSASQEIPRILWKLAVDYRVYKNPPPVPVLSQINRFHATHPQISCHFSIAWVVPKDQSRPEANIPVSSEGQFYGEELLAPLTIPMLEYHPSSAVRDCLFNIFAASLHIGGRPSTRNLRTRHIEMTGTHFPLRSLYFVWQISFIISTAIPPSVWPIEWVGNVNKISEQTESGKRYLSDNIMIIYHVYKLTGNIASIGRYTSTLNVRARCTRQQV